MASYSELIRSSAGTAILLDPARTQRFVAYGIFGIGLAIAILSAGTCGLIVAFFLLCALAWFGSAAQETEWVADLHIVAATCGDGPDSIVVAAHLEDRKKGKQNMNLTTLRGVLESAAGAAR